MYDFKPHMLYRISPIVENKQLAGKPCIFLGWTEMPGDIRRATVALMLPDGGNGEEYDVAPQFIIDI